MRKSVQYTIAGAFFAGAFAVLYWIDPLKTPLLPRCPLNMLTGLYCPGCGTLRALHRLSHMDLIGALHANPILVLSVPVLVLLIIRPNMKTKKWVPWVVFFVLLLFGIIRNIPVYPFTMLAPH